MAGPPKPGSPGTQGRPQAERRQRIVSAPGLRAQTPSRARSSQQPRSRQPGAVGAPRCAARSSAAAAPVCRPPPRPRPQVQPPPPAARPQPPRETPPSTSTWAGRGRGRPVPTLLRALNCAALLLARTLRLFSGHDVSCLGPFLFSTQTSSAPEFLPLGGPEPPFSRILAGSWAHSEWGEAVLGSPPRPRAIRSP